jgi:NAD(P)H-flavin reductase
MNLNKAVLKKKTFLTHDVVELCFEVKGEFLHKAGQFVSVKVQSPQGQIFRSYSISSKPQKNYFELCIKVIENGLASNYLANLKEGNEIEFLGPIGNFTFQNQQGQTALFIGTGTGIAPLKSIIKEELEKGWPDKIHLLFGVRYIKDIFYKEFFEKLAVKYKNFTFDLTLSRPENESWAKEGGKIGRVTDLLKNLELNPAKTSAYICGLKEMVTETTEILQQKGLLKEALYFERFN